MSLRLVVAFGLAALAGVVTNTHVPWPHLPPAVAQPVQRPPVRAEGDHAPPPVDPSVLPNPGELGDLTFTTSRSKAWLLAEGPAREPNGPRYVTLTFDDGPDPDTVGAILKLLDKHRVRGTFFFIGRYLDGNKKRAIAARQAALDIQNAGHLIGSHTHDHDLLTTDAHTQVLDQIDEGIASIERATAKRPELFRPPYGQLDAFGEQAIAERHLGLVLWSVEAGEMLEANPDEEAMYTQLVAQLDYANGGLVLLHDVKWPTVHVLARLLDWLDAKHFTIVDLPTYLRETAAHPQPFPTRKALEEARAAAWRSRHHPT